MTNENCPICGSAWQLDPMPDAVRAKCKSCGTLKIDEVFLKTLSSRLSQNPQFTWRLRHWLWSRTDLSQPVELTAQLFERIVTVPLPPPREQADNLIRWLGDSLREPPGRRLPIGSPDHLAGIIGALDVEGLNYVISWLQKSGLTNVVTMPRARDIWLTFDGWDHYEDLQKSHAEGPIAFMAMPFNNQLLECVFTDCLAPAVRRAGFDLRRIIDKQPAGVIDDQLRVAIRKSRFLISELTGRNPGAYWEAGYAEGLGKPVIYTCQKSFFENPETKPHFDANHCVTVIWDESQLNEAGSKLTTTIRATLPAEARMSDESDAT
jgi:hypothetical protein